MPIKVATEASDRTIVCTQFYLPSALFLYSVREVTASSYFLVRLWRIAERNQERAPVS